MPKEWGNNKNRYTLGESPHQIAETGRTSTMCEALKDYGKASGLTVEIGTDIIQINSAPFLGEETSMSLAETVLQ